MKLIHTLTHVFDPHSAPARACGGSQVFSRSHGFSRETSNSSLSQGISTLYELIPASFPSISRLFSCIGESASW